MEKIKLLLKNLFFFLEMNIFFLSLVLIESYYTLEMNYYNLRPCMFDLVPSNGEKSDLQKWFMLVPDVQIDVTLIPIKPHLH